MNVNRIHLELKLKTVKLLQFNHNLLSILLAFEIRQQKKTVLSVQCLSISFSFIQSQIFNDDDFCTIYFVAAFVSEAAAAHFIGDICPCDVS